jgi:GR25 family glycosyltransferase involved in LPS biosynthesis
MTAQLKQTGLDYEFITAVDGRDVDLSDATIVHPSRATRNAPVFTGPVPEADPYVPFPAGTAGAALSHLSVYKKMLGDGMNAALVLEDDVVLPPDVASLSDAVVDHLSGSEVVLLSYNSLMPCEMSRQGVIELPTSRVLALPIDILQPRSGAGYIITREACERMIRCIPPIRSHADDWRFFYREGMLDRVRCVVPLPIHKSHTLPSTIGSYSLRGGLRARIVEPLVRGNLPLVHQAIGYRRRRIHRKWSRAEFVDGPFRERPSRFE